MNVDDKIIEKIRRIGSECADVKKISLFGSRARGDHSERSDIDLAVYFFNDINYDVIEKIEEIETLLIPDITIMNDRLDKKFVDNIKKEEQIIYMVKFENKFENFKNAVKRLKAVAVQTFDDEDILRDSLIQRFEFCYELSWKTLKEYLKYNGLTTETMPRPVFKTAYEHHIIDNEQVWLSMIKDRNVASHEYNENYIALVADRIKNEYLAEFEKLCDKLIEKESV